MIVNPRRKARESVSPLRTQAEVTQASSVAAAWRARQDTAFVERSEDDVARKRRLHMERSSAVGGGRL